MLNTETANASEIKSGISTLRPKYHLGDVSHEDFPQLLLLLVSFTSELSLSFTALVLFVGRPPIRVTGITVTTMSLRLSSSTVSDPCATSRITSMACRVTTTAGSMHSDGPFNAPARCHELIRRGFEKNGCCRPYHLAIGSYAKSWRKCSTRRKAGMGISSTARWHLRSDGNQSSEKKR